MSDADYLLGAGELFTLFFVTLGPIKLLGPFARATAALSDAELRAMALRTAALAVVIAIAGGFLGRAMLASWMLPVFTLRLTTGLILFVVAFRLVMQPYDAPAPNSPPGAPQERPTAMTLVFPMVLTPYGIAAVIVLLAISHGSERSGLIVAVLVAVMLLNLLAMAFVRPILATGAPVLQAVGAVLGVLQVALAVQIILTALRGLGVLPSPAT